MMATGLSDDKQEIDCLVADWQGELVEDLRCRTERRGFASIIDCAAKRLNNT